MKLNKFAVSMGLATAVLTGCSSGGTSEADFNITALDGYIVHGLVTTTCDDKVFTGYTNHLGVAPIVAYGLDITGCTSIVEGVEGTYDTDQPDVPWTGTMATLPGLAVINPFTDIAVTVSEVPGNESLSREELKNKVLELLGYDDNHPSAAVLFEDFGANSTRDLSDNAEVAFVAQAVFDVKSQLLASLAESAETKSTRTIGYYTFTAAQVVAFYDAVLTKVTGAAAAAVEEILGNEGDISLYAVKIKIPKSIMDDVIGAIEDIEAATTPDALNAAKLALDTAASELTSETEIVIISVTPDATGTGSGGTGSNTGG